MTLEENQRTLEFALAHSPELAAIIQRMGDTPHAVYVGKRGALPGIFKEERFEDPLLIIRSARLTDDWGNETDGPNFTLDGCDAGFDSNSYLTWPGSEFTLSIDSYDVRGIFNDSYRSACVSVLWVTQNTITHTTFTIHKDFLDFAHVSSQARHLPRFVPDESYVKAKMATFPPLISEEEQRYIGANGEPAYIVERLRDEDESKPWYE